MRVAAYIRVSTEQQLENYSIPLQLERINAYCMSRGWNKIDEYIDGGYSGSNIERPALQKLLKNIHNIDAVVVYRLDRLSRSQKDTLYLIEESFLPNNVEFISISETIDTSSPFGRAMIGILSVFAQLERETITERLKGGRYTLVKEHGYWAGGSDANPAGYIRGEKGKLVVNTEESFLVKKVFDEYIHLQSTTKIQEKFQQEGLPVWPINRYIRMLKNRLYIGEVSFAGEWFKGSHEPLIRKEIFDKVQILLHKNKKKNFGKVKNMILTKKIKCKCCGENYVSYSANSKLSDNSLKAYHYYICRKRRFPREYHSKCTNKTLSKKYVENYIFDMIESLRIEDIQKNDKIPKKNYKRLLSDIEYKIKRTIDLYLENQIDKNILDAKIKELNQTKKQLELEKTEQIQKEKTSILNLFKNKKIEMHNKDNNHKLMMINNLIKNIYVNNRELEIEWAF
ncbi:recombinase family protein [Bacillus thuringiensis]|uniref:Recombinase family protein n=1 Tax=Bacillus thuringiensis serovar andalousiensis TaxID=257985 RepID=A0A6H0TBL8_BACTU|nr:recombinase family protein [Bacillus thuringiensis]QIW18561.1 recombinase family protein [Bacillus thuringiensis serovar andalousiensis]